MFKNLILEKMTKFVTLLAKLIKKEREKTQITNIRNEREEMATDLTNIRNENKGIL